MTYEGHWPKRNSRTAMARTGVQLELVKSTKTSAPTQYIERNEMTVIKTDLYWYLPASLCLYEYAEW